MKTIRYALQDGIATLTFDEPDSPVNTMCRQWQQDMTEAAAQVLKDKDAITGIVLASAKSTFFAGADLKALMRLTEADAPKAYAEVELLKKNFRTLETLGKPVVSCINGTALGGGWEVALVGHYRVALDNPKTQLGLPEVTLGLLPGASGVTKMVRHLGLMGAQPYLVEGKLFNPREALELGLVHELVSEPAQLREAALAYIATHPASHHPWDAKDHKIPGGTPANPKVAGMLTMAPAMLKKTDPRPLPCARGHHGLHGRRCHGRCGHRAAHREPLPRQADDRPQRARHGQHLFLQHERHQGRPVAAGRRAPLQTHPGRPAWCRHDGRRHCLCAGQQGHYHGAERREYRAGRSRQGLQHQGHPAAGGQRPTQPARPEGVARPHHHHRQGHRLHGDPDLVIEAVFESRELKAKVTQEAEPMLAPGGFFASNTSTLPIGGLAAASARPEKFIGIHFFSPVDKMKLVEIIRGPQTDDETVARAFDYVQALGKMPIVVNDSRGFYTSRTFGTFVMEGAAMLGEGIPAPVIENAGLQAGMPVGPLAVLDETALSLSVHVLDQTRADLPGYQATPGELLVERMVKELKRPGRAGGGGFYDYPAGQKKTLWPQLKVLFEKPAVAWNIDELKDRLLYRQAVETARCLHEGVLTTVHDGNIGSIFGIGFPAWTGEALQFVYGMGVDAFVARSATLAARHGVGFTLSPGAVATLRQHQPTY